MLFYMNKISRCADFLLHIFRGAGACVKGKITLIPLDICKFTGKFHYHISSYTIRFDMLCGIFTKYTALAMSICGSTPSSRCQCPWSPSVYKMDHRKPCMAGRYLEAEVYHSYNSIFNSLRLPTLYSIADHRQFVYFQCNNRQTSSDQKTYICLLRGLRIHFRLCKQICSALQATNPSLHGKNVFTKARLNGIQK